ncbi:efflux transporter outer membrane subunit [uncultured Pseudacidovorax sp.]|uniref:efflux transporter outer membrane subunit n=1 Tax=uncultured Pseudacidovorax sp. TaxID=679313 RepID=UPI0025CC6CFC|nr:efflux transporter outer membrane subunit [uncultured Pseudacidovorax sp.]
MTALRHPFRATPLRRWALPLAGAAAAALLAGCAVGPDFHAPAAPAADALATTGLPTQTADAPGPAGQAQHFALGQAVASRWWTAFGSPGLDALVDGALQASPDLQAAEAALRAAQEGALAQRGGFWPTVDASLASTRQKTAGPLSSPLADGDVTLYTLHTAQLSIGYTPDVFGGLRRQVEAQDAQAEVQRFQREAVYTTLVANVVGTAIQEASLRAQIDATRQLVDLASRLLAAAERQHAAGQIGGADVAAQQSALAQVQATLPPLEKQLAAQRTRLAALTGRLPGDPLPQQFALDGLRLPAELPVSLPSQLVQQRPDVRAAEAQLHAAAAQVGVATAARLPNITLNATLGSSALGVSQLLRAGSGFWSVGGTLLQPVFHGGTLLHQQRAAQANYEQAEAQYRSTVLTAFQNTADTLQAIVSDAQTLRATAAAQAAAQKSLDAVQRQRELGAAAQADLVLAQQNLQQALLAAQQARAARLADTVALYQALGGGWQTSAALK